MYINLFIVAIIIIVYIWRYAILAIANSHLGTNLSTSEADNTISYTANLTSRLYDWYINREYKRMPFTQYYNPLSLPIIHIDDLTKQKFIDISKNFSRPIVIKGFLKNCAAVKKWNLDFFQQNYGDVLLPVIQDGSLDSHAKYITNSGNHGYICTTMNEFIKSIQDGNKMYVNNVSRIFGLFPELLTDMNLDDIRKYTGIDMTNEIHVTNLFFGGNGTGTSLHCAITGNFFYNIYGNKKWYLIDPKWSKYLRPRLSRTGLFAVSLLDICKAQPGDPILNIPRYEIILEPGDLLFNPPWWWHAVANESEYTIACANRFTDFKCAFYNNLLYSMIFFSHPISNYSDFNKGDTREDANIEFEKSLLADILGCKNKLEY